jgi:hypothetical protein
MRTLRALTLSLLALVLVSNAHADEKATLQARIDRVDAQTRLDDPALKPWYMKVNFQLYDAAGKPGEQGTFEEWWAGPSLYKRTVTSPSYTATLIVNKEGTFRTTGSVETPYLLDMLEKQLVHPIPPVADLTGLTPELMKTSPGLPECIMYSRGVRGMAYPPSGIFPTFCMVPGKDILVASYDNGIFLLERGTMGGFQGRIVPVDVKVTLNLQGSVSIEHHNALTSHMVAMKMTPLTDADFAVSLKDMEPVSDTREKVPYSKLKAEQTGVINAVVPSTVNINKLSDPGQIQVVFGTDGHVRWMRLFSAPDPQLAAAAMAAVMQWTIKPYLINEKRVQVETTMEVPFGTVNGTGEGRGIR